MRSFVVIFAKMSTIKASIVASRTNSEIKIKLIWKRREKFSWSRGEVCDIFEQFVRITILSWSWYEIFTNPESSRRRKAQGKYGATILTWLFKRRV